MASGDARPLPQKGVAYRVTFPILDADGDLVTGATGLDSEVSKDGGTFADVTAEATEIATASGMYFLDLSATEMTADTVAIIVKTTSSGAKTTALVLYPQEADDIRVAVTHWVATAVATPTVNGVPEVDITHIGGTAVTAAAGIPEVKVASIAASAITATSIAADAITDAKVASDVTIASVTGAVGSVTGAVGSVTGAVGSVGSGGITATSIATDAIGALELAGGAADKIADHVWRRTYANARASADGDAVAFRSGLGMMGKLINKWSISGTTLTIYQEDDATSTAPGGTQTLTPTAGADPITALDTV